MVLRYTTQGSTTHMPLTLYMYALKVCRVNDIYRKAVKYNTPGVSYINKLLLRCDPSGPNEVIHWCSDHATKVALCTHLRNV